MDDPTICRSAKRYLKRAVLRCATKKEAVFQIRDFQTFLNDTLLPRHDVKPWNGALSSKVKSVEKDSIWLQVSFLCALAWALKLGMK